MSEKRLKLYEALMLRSEYDGRIQTLKKCSRKSGVDLALSRIRKKIRELEHIRIKLNQAIQEANYQYVYVFEDSPLKIGELLEIRENLNEQIKELHTCVVNSAHEILGNPDINYVDSSALLDETRRRFTKINQVLRQASYEVTVDFVDISGPPS